MLSFAVSDSVDASVLQSKNSQLSSLMSPKSASMQMQMPMQMPIDGTGNIKEGIITFPVLTLKSYQHSTLSNRPSVSSHEKNAARNLANSVKADNWNIPSVPKLLLQNITTSLQQLIDSRLRSSLMALIRQTIKIGAGSEAHTINHLLTHQDPIHMTTVVTSFSPHGPLQELSQSPVRMSSLAFSFEAVFDCKLLGNMLLTFSVKAPGTFTAAFNAQNSLISRGNVIIDTQALLKSLMDNARLVVKKTIRAAATTFTQSQNSNSTSDNDLTLVTPDAKPVSDSTQDIQENTDLTSNNNSKSKSNKLSSKTKKRCQTEDLITSYPQHLRETFQHFLTTQHAEESLDIDTEGFPPQLAKTLKLLSSQNCSDSDTSSVVSDSHHEELRMGFFGRSQNDEKIISNPTTDEKTPDVSVSNTRRSCLDTCNTSESSTSSSSPLESFADLVASRIAISEESTRNTNNTTTTSSLVLSDPEFPKPKRIKRSV
jgi:hypothetical protein